MPLTLTPAFINGYFDMCGGESERTPYWKVGIGVAILPTFYKVTSRIYLLGREDKVIG